MGGRKSDDYKGRHLLSQDGGGCHVRCGKMSLGKRISNQISVPKRSSWLKFEARVEVRTPRGLRSLLGERRWWLGQEGGNRGGEKRCISFVMWSQGAHYGTC